MKSAEKSRRWREKDPERARKAGKRYRKKNREKCRAKCRQWRKDNPEKQRASNKRWREANPDRVRKTRNSWQKKNSIRINEVRRKRYAQVKKARQHTVNIRRINRKQKLVDLFGGRCIDCGYNSHLAALEFDHIEGKEITIGNLLSSGSWPRLLAEAKKCQLVCTNCHRIRTEKRRMAG